MIFNCIAIKAEASVLGAAAVLFGDDAALAIIAACLTGLGVMANLETEMDTLTFRHLCEDAYDAMAAAGEWVVDGAVTAYNCATELWDYGVDCGMVQWLHEWLYSESYIYSTIPAANDVISDANIEVARNHTYTFYATMTYGSFSEWLLCYSDFAPITYSNGLIQAGGEVFYCIGTISSVWKSTHSLSTNGLTSISITTDFSFKDACVNTDYDLALGTVAAPGTDIETEYGEYIVIVAPNGVPDTGGDGSGDDQPKIPIIPVPVLPSYEETIQLPQEDIWKGNKVEIDNPDTGDTPDPTTGTDTDDPDSGSNDPTTPTTGTDTDPDTQPDSPGAPSTDIGKFQIDLKDFFPFCIPFDLYRFFVILCAEPEAPVFHWEFNVFGEIYSLDVDLSPWNPHAQLFRDAQVGLFIMGLLWITRKFIKW